MLLEGLDKLKKLNDLIGIQNRNLPSCSTAPQPSTPPHVLPTVKFHVPTLNDSFAITVKLKAKECKIIQGDRKKNCLNKGCIFF
jgi:hypothetical protein